jgi:hypothetical protein
MGRGPKDSVLRKPRHKVKPFVYSGAMFGKANANNRATRAFEARWPTVLRAVRQWKRRDGCRVVAQALQRLESFVM